jgi:hypothetical protein
MENNLILLKEQPVSSPCCKQKESCSDDTHVTLCASYNQYTSDVNGVNLTPVCGLTACQLSPSGVQLLTHLFLFVFRYDSRIWM